MRKNTLHSSGIDYPIVNIFPAVNGGTFSLLLRNPTSQKRVCEVPQGQAPRHSPRQFVNHIVQTVKKSCGLGLQNESKMSV